MPRPPRVPPVVGFDLDMTLVNSSDGIFATVQAVLAERGVHVTFDQVWPLIGVPLEATVAVLAPGVDPVEATRRYREIYPEVGVPRTTTLPGAQAALDAVRGLGGRALVVSAKARAAVGLVVDQVGLDADALVGGLFAEAKGEYLRTVGAVVYVGDHPGDVVAAQVAGATSVAVATGPHSAQELAAAGADVVLADLTGFPAWLAGHLGARTLGPQMDRPVA